MADLISVLLLAVIGAIAVFGASSFGEGDHVVGPAFLPLVLGIATLAGAGLILWQTVGRKVPEGGKPPLSVRTVIVFVLICGFIALWTVGVNFYVLLAGLILGLINAVRVTKPTLRQVVTDLVLTIALISGVYFVFVRSLNLAV